MNCYLCIDLEATSRRSGLLVEMEAIELGVVAVDESGVTIGEYQSYIKPKFTELTNYSTSIHNITQSALDSALYLPAVLREFQQWMATLPNTPTRWYSWGSYDIRQLELDAGPERWNVALNLPEHLNAKKLFQKNQLKKGRQVGLKKALNLVGCEFVGQKHSALDDARNIACLFEFFHTNERAQN
ncbi:MAG: exonuclease domain-containing protein [Kordiimonadaceae bacterium]|nr:exonuclease domain-containing protein [Kordiimonadaceae bacterium]MBO6569331.1 exonuclease domain-containing protein [Kordiimonadaceae bacterium]MBO6964806.1 exonuclease domain-containing protein [Kordiimonadaceae bacterium]